MLFGCLFCDYAVTRIKYVMLAIAIAIAAGLPNRPIIITN